MRLVFESVARVRQITFPTMGVPSSQLDKEFNPSVAEREDVPGLLCWAGT